SRTYELRVLRRPGIVQFRVRYMYPASANQRPKSIVNDDGVLEAPVGTEALVDLVCTEPVASAMVVVDGKRLVSQQTAEPNVYRVSIPITHSTPYQVELRSDRGVAGIVPSGTMIRVSSDAKVAAVESENKINATTLPATRPSHAESPIISSSGAYDA